LEFGSDLKNLYRGGEYGKKTEDMVFKLYNRTWSISRSTNIHKAWIGRPSGRPKLHVEQEPSWVGRPGGRPTFPVSLAMPEDLARQSGLNEFWTRPGAILGFLLLRINKGSNPFLGLRIF